MGGFALTSRILIENAWFPLTYRARAHLAAQVLQDWNEVRRPGTDLVFPGQSMTAYFPRKAWKEALETAQLEDFRFHDLRHTFASYLAMSGATLAELAEALGHRSLTMVKRYAHLTEGHTVAVIARMTGRFMEEKAARSDEAHDRVADPSRVACELSLRRN